MLIISYDISDTKLRDKFSKTLTKHGARRLQLSVYEVRNSSRVIGNLLEIIDHMYKTFFDGDDSVMIFTAQDDKTIKYGNAIHRDQDLLII